MEAKFKGGAKWYSGSVVAVNRDGSYDIRYDDGDKEQRVLPSNVRLVEDGKAVKPSGGRLQVEDETVSGKSAFKLGDKTAVVGDEVKAAALQTMEEWNRSKIMVVGEGRAGKTALVNAILGKQFVETSSTIGIAQLMCDVTLTAVGRGSGCGCGNWDEVQKPEKELEEALARIVVRKREMDAAAAAAATQTRGTANANNVSSPVHRGGHAGYSATKAGPFPPSVRESSQGTATTNKSIATPIAIPKSPP